MQLQEWAKGKKFNLTNENGEKIYNFCIGLSWGAIRRKYFLNLLSFKENVDLDASVAIFDKDKGLTDQVYYGKLVSDDHSVKHFGDDLIGENRPSDSDDNEVIAFDLSRISPKVQSLVLFLTSFRNQDFERIPYTEMNFYTGATPSQKNLFAKSTFRAAPEGRNKFSFIVIKLIRTEDFWEMQLLGESVEPARIPTCVDVIKSRFL
jgi:tellurium resistance protein TerZ